MCAGSDVQMSYHNHTRWSDGDATLAEMLDGARQAGLDEVGISDHYVLAPGGKTVCWSMPLDFLGEYVAEVQAAKARATDLTVRLGLEADYFPETVEDLCARLAAYPFDYLIGSVHLVNDFPIDEEAVCWERLAEDERNAVWRRYWKLVADMACSRTFDIAGHLDLPKKFGFLPTIDLTAEAHAALDAIAAAKMTLELNTAGWYKPIHEPYPSEALLRQAQRRGIPLIINADAHSPRDLRGHFDRAKALAAAAGYTTLSGFSQRERFTIPL